MTMGNLGENASGKEEGYVFKHLKIIELVGTSDKSWEEAAKNAMETKRKSLRELRIAVVTKLDHEALEGQEADEPT